MARHIGRGQILSAVAVVALAVIVAVLAALALQHGNATPRSDGGPTVPASSGSATPSTPAPTPDETEPAETETPAPPAAPAAADERFLAFNDTQVWRATAGSCDGDSPSLELSTDDGDSWEAAGPSGLAQVLGLSSYGQVDAEMVGARDGCEPELMRTYTGGTEWESYAGELASATYLSPEDGTTVVTPGPDVEAPCDQPVSVRGSRGAVGLICDGTAYRLVDGDWDELASDALAMDAASGDLIVAHLDDECDGGAAVTRFEGGDGAFVGCFDDVDAAEPAALSALGDTYMLWTGDALLRL